jgi:phage tail-like protein
MKQNDIKRLLPTVFQRAVRPGAQSPLFALLQVMEDLHQPSEVVLAQIETYFDPRRAPDQFVPYLAQWVDLEWILTESPAKDSPASRSLPSGMGLLRELVAAAAFLAKWRGTRAGLLRFLQIATGLKGFDLVENVTASGQPRPYHLWIRAPKDTTKYQAMIDRIISLEKPAYVTYELTFDRETPGG